MTENIKQILILAQIILNLKVDSPLEIDRDILLTRLCLMSKTNLLKLPH